MERASQRSAGAANSGRTWSAPPAGRSGSLGPPLVCLAEVFEQQYLRVARPLDGRPTPDPRSEINTSPSALSEDDAPAMQCRGPPTAGSHEPKRAVAGPGAQSVCAGWPRRSFRECGAHACARCSASRRGCPRPPKHRRRWTVPPAPVPRSPSTDAGVHRSRPPGGRRARCDQTPARQDGPAPHYRKVPRRRPRGWSCRDSSKPGSCAGLAGRLRCRHYEPSERYVIAPAGTTQFRLEAGNSGFDNLVVAGDWIRTGLNVGCVEATVMSGKLASHAISRQPPLDTIIGYQPPSP